MRSRRTRIVRSRRRGVYSRNLLARV